MAGKPEGGVVPHDGAVLPVGEEDPALVAGHAQDFAFLLQLEGVRLFRISPGGVAAALDQQIAFVVHGTVRHFDSDRCSVHPFRLAGDGFLSRGLDPDDRKPRVLRGKCIVLIDTFLGESDDDGFRHVDVGVGSGQLPVAQEDAVRLRGERKLHGGEIRFRGQDGRERVGFRVQGGIDAVDPDAGNEDSPFYGFFDGFFFVFLTGEEGERCCQQQEDAIVFHGVVFKFRGTKIQIFRSVSFAD